MKKLLNSSRWIYYILGLISAIIIISSLFFMTQYRFLRVNYLKETLVVDTIYSDAQKEQAIPSTDPNYKSKETWLTYKTNRYPSVEQSWFETIWDGAANGKAANELGLNNISNIIVYDKNARLNNADQGYLFNFVSQLAAGNKNPADGYNKYNGKDAQKYYEENADIQVLLSQNTDGTFEYLDYEESVGALNRKIASYSISQTMFKKVADFRNTLDNYNNLILAYGIVSLILFALLIVLSNHNRKIYYKANLIGGIALPLVNVVFALILIIQGITIISNIGDPTNNAFYNIISALQNPKVGINYQYAASEETNLENAKTIISNFNINSTTAVIYVIFFGLTAVYNIFLIIFAFLKYKDTEKARNEVLEKARLAGEKA